jgi:hypothetical protein
MQRSLSFSWVRNIHDSRMVRTSISLFARKSEMGLRLFRTRPAVRSLLAPLRASRIVHELTASLIAVFSFPETQCVVAVVR